MRAGDRGDAREASFRGIAGFPYIRARTRTHVYVRDCFGSRRCRGNANSHARGDIHNTVPLITHCLCDGTIPLFFPHLLPVRRRCLARKCTSRIRANHNKICNASERGVIRFLPWYFSSTLLRFPSSEKGRGRGRKRKNEREIGVSFP